MKLNQLKRTEIFFSIFELYDDIEFHDTDYLLIYKR